MQATPTLKCGFLFTRGINTGKPCGKRCLESNKLCNRHISHLFWKREKRTIKEGTPGYRPKNARYTLCANCVGQPEYFRCPVCTKRNDPWHYRCKDKNKLLLEECHNIEGALCELDKELKAISEGRRYLFPISK